jgi:hypothetical protein
VATLITQPVNRAGVTPTYAAAAGGGDACEVGDDIFLQVNNSGTQKTVTLAIPAAASPYPNAAYTSTAVVVPATTGDKMIGPISAGLYKDPTTGLCTITYSPDVAGLTVGVFKLQAP